MAFKDNYVQKFCSYIFIKNERRFSEFTLKYFGKKEENDHEYLFENAKELSIIIIHNSSL